jgi:hypothetical protein
VFSVHYQGFIKALRFFPNVLQKLLIKKKFEELERLCNAKFDLVWSFDNSVFYNFKALPDSVYSISHIVDYSQDFEFEKSSKTADLCLASSKYIVKKQKQYNLRSYIIGHGFNKVNGHSTSFKLKGRGRINCGYAGNLDIKYIDWVLVEALINDFADIDFHFAGQWSSESEFQHISKRPNFYFYGKLPSDELPIFYENLDILILTYQYDKYPEQLANPHKMMEYLGSSKVILATWTNEYEDLASQEVIKMAKTREEYLVYFKLIIENLDDWNSANQSEKRKAFALNNTYLKQIEKIEGLLNE